MEVAREDMADNGVDPANTTDMAAGYAGVTGPMFAAMGHPWIAGALAAFGGGYGAGKLADAGTGALAPDHRGISDRMADRALQAELDTDALFGEDSTAGDVVRYRDTSAASRGRVLSVPQMPERLTERFRLLSSASPSPAGARCAAPSPGRGSCSRLGLHHSAPAVRALPVGARVRVRGGRPAPPQALRRHLAWFAALASQPFSRHELDERANLEAALEHALEHDVEGAAQVAATGRSGPTAPRAGARGSRGSPRQIPSVIRTGCRP